MKRQSRQLKPDFTNIDDLRVALDRSRALAMANFERDWGTRDVRIVADALSQTIPGSASPADAATKALALVRGRAA